MIILNCPTVGTVKKEQKVDLQCTCKSMGQVYLQKCEGCNFMVYDICTYCTWFGLVYIFETEYFSV